MTSTLVEPTGSNPDPARGASAGTGHFMLTLCRLAAPVTIRPFQSPQLKPFTYFMSRTRQPDGGERLYLHMGYFETLADAERWADTVCRQYPNAFATIAPVGLRRGDASAQDASMSDTQVLKMLETRHAAAVQNVVDERALDHIELLRPEDTGTRQALREAVVQGAPVSFAVQLHWSAQPIDLSRVPSLAIFKAHTLYATETRREGRSRHFLRLGFFADPISAKQVAVQVRSTFSAAAVVPILEQEVTRARAAVMGSSAIPDLAEQRVEPGIDADGTPVSPTPSEPSSDASRHRPAPHAGTQVSTDAADLLNDSGVRHLRVEVQEESTGRWKVIRLGATPSDEARAYP